MVRDSSWKPLGNCQPSAGGLDVGPQEHVFREKPREPQIRVLSETGLAEDPGKVQGPDTCLGEDQWAASIETPRTDKQQPQGVEMGPVGRNRTEGDFSFS